MTHFLQATQSPNIGAATTGKGATNSGGQEKVFGMPMWFSVVVFTPGGGKTGLGEWSACQGLKVDFKTEAVPTSDVVGYAAPATIEYGQITLERAMEFHSSLAVRNWLQEVSNNWIKGPEGGAGLLDTASGGYPGVDMTITLYSSLTSDRGASNEVTHWNLRNVIPTSWSGPNLSSKGGSEVATEKLTLYHRGFLSDANVGATNKAATSPGKNTLTLTRVDNSSETIEFQYSPKTIKYSVTTSTGSNGAVKFSSDQSLGLVEGKLTLAIADLRVEGVTKVGEAWTLLKSWVEPAADPKAPNSNPKPVVLKVSMGPAAASASLDQEVVLRRVTFNCTRFTSDGLPNRADVNLDLQEPNDPSEGDGAGAKPASSSPAPGAGAGSPAQGTGQQGGAGAAGAPGGDRTTSSITARQ